MRMKLLLATTAIALLATAAVLPRTIPSQPSSMPPSRSS
jgi:hypothetical protein